jgi:hypothetical protein
MHELVSGQSERRTVLIDEMAPLIEQQYRYLEQAVGKRSLEALSAALEAFMQARSGPVQQVPLP